jgi:predicted DsbA family dithiol-disulfide isomerase
VIDVVHYTDPGCPIAFSVEPLRLRMEWTYGDQLAWDTVMIVLSEDVAALEAKGMTPAKAAAGQRRLQARSGMPFDPSERPRLAPTAPACRAIVATRLHRPELELQLLRRLRVRSMGGGVLDDQALIDAAAADVGIDPSELADWIVEHATEQALHRDMQRARSPLPAACALDHKLMPTTDGVRRYGAPSIELHAGEHTCVAPGRQPWETYETLLANLDPSLQLRPAPTEVLEVLGWATCPLATVEVAAIMQARVDDVRASLQADASFQPVGEDGYWSLRS